MHPPSMLWTSSLEQHLVIGYNPSKPNIIPGRRNRPIAAFRSEANQTSPKLEFGGASIGSKFDNLGQQVISNGENRHNIYKLPLFPSTSPVSCAWSCYIFLANGEETNFQAGIGTSVMAQFHYEFRTSRTIDYAILTGAACLSIYWYLRPILNPGDPVKPRRVIRSKARDAAELALTDSASGSSGRGRKLDLPYPPDVFLGGRTVETAYGTIKVFEWGPEHGEKVLLLHGIGTPCVALGDMAKEFVRKGCRVMLFDLFGRGYSDSPSDLLYDDRLYTTQILLALASSPIPWTGSSAFHIVGYSLGGALSASFAAYHPNLLRSATLICPGGLVRPSHVSLKSRVLYSEGLLPSWLINRLARHRLEPQPGTASADVPDPSGEGDDSQDVDFDQVPVCAEDAAGPNVGDVVKWQLRNNEGFVPAYMSTIRNAPIYGQHEGVWRRLSEQLALRRQDGRIPGLEGGRICLILAERDPIVVKEEWIADSFTVLGEDAVDIRVLKGGHEIAISKGREVANVAMAAWRRQ